MRRRRLAPVATSLALAFALVASGEMGAARAQSPRTCATAPADAETVYACAQRAEEDALERWPTQARRDGARLSLRLQDGRGFTLEDTPSDTPADSVLRFTLVDFLPPLPAYVVRVHRRAGAGAWLLIDARTGARTVLDAAPVPAPSGGRFAAPRTADADGTGAGVVIWRMGATGPAEEWRYLPSEAAGWTEVALVWLGPARLRLVVTEEDAAQTWRRERAVALARTAAGWRVAP